MARIVTTVRNELFVDSKTYNIYVLDETASPFARRFHLSSARRYLTK